jgi:hypothetical protein
MVQVVECLPSKPKVLSSNPSTIKNNINLVLNTTDCKQLVDITSAFERVVLAAPILEM